MAKKVLITGISGFAGSFLASHLLKKNDYEIYGTYLSDNSLQNLADSRDKLTLRKLDLNDSDKVASLVQDVKPDWVFHLAALPSPAESFKNPAGFLTNNITAEVNILEALRTNDLTNSRMLIVASAEVYGLVDSSDLPVDEETKFRPISPYGVSKIAQDLLGLQYVLSYDMDIVRVRPFNHLGPRLSPQFAPSAFAKKIVEIETGKEKPILTVGNLEAKRDYTDVRDVVVGYELLLEKGKKGDVYNLGSGKSHKMSEILSTLLSFSKAKIEIKVDKSLLRPNDIPEFVCDHTKITRELGWEPTIPINQSLKDTLDYWRQIG